MGFGRRVVLGRYDCQWLAWEWLVKNDVRKGVLDYGRVVLVSPPVASDVEASRKASGATMREGHSAAIKPPRLASTEEEGFILPSVTMPGSVGAWG